jgi:hypothetical protein
MIVVGGGRPRAHQHALAMALAASPLVGEVHCLPGNGGTMAKMGWGKVSNADMMGASTTMDKATVIWYVRRVNAHTVMSSMQGQDWFIFVSRSDIGGKRGTESKFSSSGPDQPPGRSNLSSKT